MGMLFGEARSQVPELKAIVVHKVDGRVYLNAGSLRGIRSDWIVRISSLLAKPAELSWIGEDLCRIDLPAEVAAKISVGDTLDLVDTHPRGQGGDGHAFHWGMTAMPTSLDLAPVSMADWDFREAVSSRIGAFVSRFGRDDRDNSVWYVRPLPFAGASGGQSIDAFTIATSLRMLCEKADIFAVFTEHFRLAQGTLACVAATPFMLQTNFPTGCGRELSLIDAPGSYVVNAQLGQPLFDNGSGAYSATPISDSLLMLVERPSLPDRGLVDTIFFHIYPTYEDALLAFRVDEIDGVEVAPFNVRAFDRSYQVLSCSTSSAVFLSVNNSKPYLIDHLFAAVLNYLIDKNALCRIPLGGAVEPIEYPDVPDDLPAKVSFSFDPAKGRALLKALQDLPAFMSIYVTDPSDQGLVRTAEFVRGVLARESIAATIYKEPPAAAFGAYEDPINSFDLMVSRLDDPGCTGGQLLYQSIYHADLADPRQNRSLFHSEEAEALFDSYYTGCFDETPAGRESMRKLIAQHLGSPSGVWLYKPVRKVVVSRRVESIEFFQPGIIDFTSVRFR
jgi:hypothetical protein